MIDLYNKPDKAGRKQQIRSRLTLLNDELTRISNEKTEILCDIVLLTTELSLLNEVHTNDKT